MWAAGLAALVTSGCEGKISWPGGPGAEPSQAVDAGRREPPFSCAEDALAPELPLRRLSHVQYVESIRDLAAVLAPSDSAAVLAALEPQLGAMPVDARGGPDPAYGGLRRLDQAIYQRAVEGSYEVASALGKALVASPARLTAAAGACATDADASNDAACLEAFIRKLGRRALRRPLSDDDVAFYRGVAGTTLERDDYADVVTVLLSAPRFLYFVEEAPEASPSGAVKLDAFALASRLSFHFWQTIPDEALLASAESGALLTPEGYRAQVERLFADPRTAKALDEFFGEWLDPEYVGRLDANVGNVAFDAFRGDFTPTVETREHMHAELQRMGRFYAHDREASFADFFTSRRSFAEHADVASLYGVPAWTAGEPPLFPSPEREGLLGRALLLATGSPSTRPIMKGVFVRKALLCDTIPVPPGDAMTVAMGVQATGFGARARAEAISQARVDCAGCHRGLINPLGFVSEGFDALGRARTSEKVYDKTTGALVADEPLDLTATPLVTFEDERTASSLADLDRYMLESEKPQACFARRYFRFTFGRKEDDARDGCTLSALHELLVRGDSLSSVLRELALRPDFSQRTFEP